MRVSPIPTRNNLSADTRDHGLLCHKEQRSLLVLVMLPVVQEHALVVVFVLKRPFHFDKKGMMIGRSKHSIRDLAPFRPFSQDPFRSPVKGRLFHDDPDVRDPDVVIVGFKIHILDRSKTARKLLAFQMAYAPGCGEIKRFMAHPRFYGFQKPVFHQKIHSSCRDLVEAAALWKEFPGDLPKEQEFLLKAYPQDLRVSFGNDHTLLIP